VKTLATRALIKDLRDLITQARQDVARSVNFSLVMLYWKVGQWIQKKILKERRTEYGEEIVATVSRQLSREFGPGFAEKGLRRMIQFAQVFADEAMVATLSRHLGCGATLLELFRSKTSSGASFMRKCAGSSNGACGS
jgi:hypothetical protein